MVTLEDIVRAHQIFHYERYMAQNENKNNMNKAF